LDVLFADREPTTRRLAVQLVEQSALQGTMSLGGLFVAVRGDRITGAILAEPAAGRGGSVFPPSCQKDEEDDSLDLVDAALEHLRQSGARWSYCLVPPNESQAIQRLVAGGFLVESEVVSMACPASGFGDSEPRDGLAFVSFRDELRDRMLSVVEQTYLDSRDCPSLSRLRSAADALESHRAAGPFEPRRWRFAVWNGQDVGCVLTAALHSEKSGILSYMGLVPSARGRGLGGALVREAQSIASRAGWHSLLLGVDLRNVPAIRLYEAAGFFRTDSHQLLLRSLIEGEARLNHSQTQP
jgi:GNAT superfamily N-acetyltransferase